MNKLHTLILLFAVELVSLARSEFIFNPNPISSVRLSDISNMTALFFSVAKDNSYAFVTINAGGFFIIDLQNIQQPTVKSFVMTSSAFGMFHMDNYLFVADAVEGFIIYNLTDINTPSRIYTSGKYLSLRTIVVTSDMKYAFLGGLGRLYCFDISNLNNPVLLSSQGVDSPNTYRIRLNEKEEFMIMANHILGVQIIDVRDKLSMKIRLSSVVYSTVWDGLFSLDSQQIFIADTFAGIFTASIAGLEDIDVSSSTLLTPTFTNIYSRSEVAQSVALTTDGNYLLAGFRSVGIMMFDISNKSYSNPTFIQNLEGSYLCNQIIISKEGSSKYAYATDGHSFVIYLSGKPFINKEFPNIFNSFQSSIDDTFISSSRPWEIKIFSNDTKIVVAGSTDSTKIYSIEKPVSPKQLSKIDAINQVSYDGVSLRNTVEKFDVMYIGGSELGFFTYDITDITNPTLKSHIVPVDTSSVNDSDGVTVSSDNSILVIANGSLGISVYNIKDDRYSPAFIASYVNDAFGCTFEKCAILSDNSFIYCSCREAGLVTFQFTGTQVFPVSIYIKVGCERPLLSSDESIIYVAAGFQGMVILDNSLKYRQSQLSSLPLDGWAQGVVLIKSENYAIFTETEKGGVVVVNIEDKSNPYIFSKLVFPLESFSDLCITSNEKFLYFIGNFGLRHLPLDTGITIHTQISKLVENSSGITYYQIVDSTEKLKVGSTIEMVFVPLYTAKNFDFQTPTYYREFESVPLPSWMTFLKSHMKISMVVDKLGTLNTFSTEKNGENVVVLEILQEIEASDFVISSISSSMAKVILATLKSDGYVSQYGFLQSSFQPYSFSSLNFYDSQYFPKADYAATDQEIQSKIKQVLVASKISYPIRFFIESSLKFNYLLDLSKNSLLETSSANLIATFNILTNGIFVKKTFEGVLVSFADDLSSLKIEGSKDKVNEIVSKNLQVANKTADLSKIQITAKISDSSNYDLYFSESLKVFSFIFLNNPVFLNVALQKQFNGQYDNSELYVQSSFSFAFLLTTFGDKDNLELTYTAFIVTDKNNPVQIVSNSGQWISFNSATLVNYSPFFRRLIIFLIIIFLFIFAILFHTT